MQRLVINGRVIRNRINDANIPMYDFIKQYSHQLILAYSPGYCGLVAGNRRTPKISLGTQVALYIMFKFPPNVLEEEFREVCRVCFAKGIGK